MSDDAGVEIAPYERRDLGGVVGLCEAEGWPSFPADPERAHRILTAPGVTAVVARDGIDVVGFAYLQSDGEIQAHLSNIAVAQPSRRQGIARQLLQLAIERAGGERIDLITDTAPEFYESLSHKSSDQESSDLKHWNGYRIHPPFL